MPRKGYKQTEDVKRAKSERMRGKGNHFYGETHSDKSRKEISASLKGRPSWNKGHTSETDPRIPTGKNHHMYGKKSHMSGKKHTEESLKLMREAQKGENNPMYGKKGRDNPHYGRKRSKETGKKISIAKKGKPGMRGKDNPMYGRTGEKHPMFGKKRTEKTRKQISEKAIRNWQDPEFQKKSAIGRKTKPNKPEIFLMELLETLYPNDWKYVGDLQFFLGGKNPDFMNVNGEKKLIELYGDYWHRDDDPQDRVDHFKQYGFNTLIIWESELENLSMTTYRIHRFMRR